MGQQWLIIGRQRGSSGCAELEFWLSESTTGWKAQAAEQHICYGVGILRGVLIGVVGGP